MGEAEEERIAVVQMGGDEAVNKDGGGVGGEGGAESVDVAEMEICSAGNGVDVRVEGMCAIEDDTQAKRPQDRSLGHTGSDWGGI